MIQTKKLCKTYDHKDAVVDLDLSVGQGELFGFLGPNGAGKTTTIRMLTGLLKPTSGTAVVAGHDILTEPLAVKASIGYLAEAPFLYDKLTGREFLRFMGDLYRVPTAEQRREIERLVELFGLQENIDQLVETYSHGTRRKIALCGVLLHNPAVLFLDEPTNGLDPRSARIVKEVLRGLVVHGTTVFMSSHILEIVEHMCDRVGIIDRGHLVAVGTLDELRAGTGGVTQPGSSLEDIFLALTGGAEYEQIAAFLREA
jgi:ABC-2 type transport system ATP-binding protein